MSLPEFAPSSGSRDPSCAEAPARTVEREARTNLFLAAQLTLPGERARDVRLRNLSPSGAKVDIKAPPPVGATLLLSRGAAKAAAEVVWVAATSCGLRFSQPIDVAGWVSDRPSALANAGPEPSLADDLVLARRLVDRLEDALGAEPALIAALGTELQALDLLGQLLQSSHKRAQGSTVPAIRSLRQAIATLLRQPGPDKGR